MLATPGVVAAAGPRGIIPLEIEGEQVAARIVGTVDRFPSVIGDAVVADRETAATVLDTRSGGLGTTDELWLTVPAEQQAATAAALARAPFNELQVQSQAETLARLRADPLARGALLTLAGTAAVALLLALLGLLLAVVGDVRDDRGELFDLEAQGAAPSTVRAHLRLRALLVAALRDRRRLVLGTILSALVISLVSVTAGAAESEPPLRLDARPAAPRRRGRRLRRARRAARRARDDDARARHRPAPRRRRHERDRAEGRLPRPLDARG